MSLSPSRLDRFARHIVLPEVGGVGQVAHWPRRTLCLSAAAGSAARLCSTSSGAGVGTADADRQRRGGNAATCSARPMFTPADVGRPKAEVAARLGGAVRSGPENPRGRGTGGGGITPRGSSGAPPWYSTAVTISRRGWPFPMPAWRLASRLPAPRSGASRARSPISPGIWRGNPATAALWAMPSMPRIAIPARQMACWARLPARSGPLRRCMRSG
jgi:hypothetical protein